jgi:hypothetical protein
MLKLNWKHIKGSGFKEERAQIVPIEERLGKPLFYVPVLITQRRQSGNLLKIMLQYVFSE